MAIADTNSIIRAYLITCGTLTALLATVDSIYCPCLPENAGLPAVSFLTRGGTSTPYIPGIPSPSVEFDCWADNLIDAREVYRALYDNLQGNQNQIVAYPFPLVFPIIWSHSIMSAIEDSRGADLVDIEIPNRFRKRTSFTFMLRAE